MNRDQAYQLLTKHLKNKNLIKHCIACEISMMAIYDNVTPASQQSDEDRSVWGITGLLHDIDYEIAQNENKLNQHGLLIFDIEKDTIPEPIAYAIKAHNFENTGVNPESNLDWAIACVDGLTGLIVACALIHPDKKLDSINTEFVMKRFNEKSFAKGARRESISRVEEHLDISLEKFIDITLSAMQKSHTELGL